MDSSRRNENSNKKGGASKGAARRIDFSKVAPRVQSFRTTSTLPRAIDGATYEQLQTTAAGSGVESAMISQNDDEQPSTSQRLRAAIRGETLVPNHMANPNALTPSYIASSPITASDQLSSAKARAANDVKMSSLLEKMQVLEQEKQYLMFELNRLNAFVTGTRLQLSSLQREKRLDERQLYELNQLIEESKEHIAAKESELLTLLKMVKNLKSEKDNLAPAYNKEEVEQFIKQNISLKKRNERLLRNKQEDNDEINRVQVQLFDLRQEHYQLQKALRNANEATVAKAMEVRVKNRQVESLLEKMQNLSTKLICAQQEHEDAMILKQAEITNAQEQTKCHQDAIHEFQQTIDELIKERAALEENMQILEMEIKQFRHQNELQRNINVMQKQRHDSEVELMRDCMDQNQHEIHELENEKKLLTSELPILRQEIARHRIKLTVLETSKLENEQQKSK